MKCKMLCLLLKEYSPNKKVFVDECFMDMTKMDKFWDLLKVAYECGKDKKRIGFTVSIGISTCA